MTNIKPYPYVLHIHLCMSDYDYRNARQAVNMEKGDLFSVVFLCITNIVFMVAGIFLNSVVIISLWRSRQLRKKVCYFMILVLSCVDLAVVTITHPSLIASTIYFSLEEINDILEDIRVSVSFVLCGSSMSALFMLSVERFLALNCPYFHQTSVTKKRLLGLLAFWTIIIVGLSPLIYFNTKTVNIIINIFSTVCVSSLLFLFIYANYKMLKLAKSIRADERLAPSSATLVDGKRKKQISNLKNISTCSLAVACFFVCSCPQIIYSALRLASGAPSFVRQTLLFSLWSNTFVSINSTFNCLIFFWRNSILRREGIKIINAFRIRVVK